MNKFTAHSHARTLHSTSPHSACTHSTAVPYTLACIPPAAGGVCRPGRALCAARTCGQTCSRSVAMGVRAVRTTCTLQGMHTACRNDAAQLCACVHTRRRGQERALCCMRALESKLSRTQGG